MAGSSKPLRDLVEAKFISARTSGELVFSATSMALVRSELPAVVQLRFCPALAKKAQEKPDNKPSQKKIDPFDDPSKELLVGEMPAMSPSHNVILNKYPVIQNHFILATKDNKPQANLLDQEDLFLSYRCLESWEDNSEDRADHSLFAFFNSGEHSGASQPHRHLQFLPIADMRGDEGEGWQLLCNTMVESAHPTLPLLHNPNLPVIHFAVTLSSDLNAAGIHSRYMLLMKAAFASISSEHGSTAIDDVVVDENGASLFSYNLAMTRHILAILPRRKDSAQISGTTDGFIFVNGTILAGTMMVRSESDWNHIRQQPKLVQQILRDIAYSRKSDQACEDG